MSNKYIIKNCPTLMGNRLCFGKYTKQCADCTDCVMKQIVELCKDTNYHYVDGVIDLQNYLLKLLDIQEVE